MNHILRSLNQIGFTLVLLVFVSCKPSGETNSEPLRPNILIFYVDDLGYGDVSSYGAKTISTPNIDDLAANGLRFTDGHSSAATCTPSRYSLLTGEYAFRNNAAILPGDAPLLIDPSKPTMPKMLKRAGYQTAVIGKWHLGLGDGNIQWNGEVKPGPLEIGFDYSFLLPSTGDRVPSVYLENYKVVGLSADDSLAVSYKKKIGNRPTGKENPELLRYKADNQHNKTIINGVSRIGYMAGGKSAEWVDEEFPGKFIEKAAQFMDDSKQNPFFLFFSFHDIHVPRLPMDRFKGKSGMGPRGDAILQMDYTVGEVMKLLKERGIDQNTLVVFTSDNGAVINDGYADEAVKKLGDHQPNGPFSGGKYSALEAGTRVPTIAYWPGMIAPGVTDAMFSQVDLFESFAVMLNVPLEPNEAIDSEDLSGLILGDQPTGRDFMIEESATLALRKGDWKYIRPFPKGQKYPDWIEGTKDIPSGLSFDPQLFNLKNDPAEEENLATKYPGIVEELEQSLSLIVQKESGE